MPNRNPTSHSSASSHIILICLLVSLLAAEPPLTTDLSPEIVAPFDAERRIEGAGLPITIEEAPGVVSVFSGEDIRRSGYMDITDFLRALPNFYIERYYNRPDQVSLTYFGASQPTALSVYVDDFLIGSLYDGTADISRIPLETVERVEVWHSPVADNGYGGSNAVVRIYTRRGRLERASSWLCFTDSTYDRERYKMDFGNSLGPLDLRLGGSREISTGWLWETQSRMSNISGWARLFSESPFNITLAGDRFGRYQQMVSPRSQEEIYYSERTYQDEVRYDLEGRVDWEFIDNNELSLRYIYGDEERALVLPSELWHPSEIITQFDEVFEGSRDKGIRQEAMMGYRLMHGKSGFILDAGWVDHDSNGAAARYNEINESEVVHYSGDSEEPWAKARWVWVPNDVFTLVPQVRYSNIVDSTRFDPGLDMSWRFSPAWKVHANGTSGYTRYLPRRIALEDAPSLTTYIGGEAGLQVRHPWRGEAGILGYYRQEQDRPETGSYIVHEEVTAMGGGVWFAFNPWIPDLYLSASASIDQAQAADGINLPMIPSERMHTRVEYSLGFFEDDLCIGAAAETDFVGRRTYVYTDHPDSSSWQPQYGKLSTYSLINLLGYIQIVQLRMFANFYNITANRSHIVIPGYYSPGYEMSIGVTWQLFD